MNAVLTPSIKLVPNSDETYDLILEYNGIDVEFAEELDVQKSIKSHSKTITKSILSQAKKVKIKRKTVTAAGVFPKERSGMPISPDASPPPLTLVPLSYR